MSNTSEIQEKKSEEDGACSDLKHVMSNNSNRRATNYPQRGMVNHN